MYGDKYSKCNQIMTLGIKGLNDHLRVIYSIQVQASIADDVLHIRLTTDGRLN